MKIISNRKNKKGFNISWDHIIANRWYIVIFLVCVSFIGVTSFLGAEWIIMMRLLASLILVNTIVILFMEYDRIENIKGYEYIDSDYSKKRLNLVPLILFPIIYIIMSIPNGLAPMINDYKNSERIDKILTLDSNTKLYWNDYNNIFILFINDTKNPLTINLSRSPNTYTEIKADFLDNKIKIVKKEVKSWLDNESKIVYTLNGYTFH